MVFVVASVSAFVTWLTLSYSQVDIMERVAGSAIIFLAVGGTLVHYVLGCIKRHCTHQHKTKRGHQTAN
jgi:hypothetical protein